MFSLWQARPVFLTGGAWHPLTLLLGLHGTVYEITLLAFGVVTSLVAIRHYALAPSRRRWLTAAIAVTLAIFGMSATTLPWLALIAIGGLWISRRAESTLGVLTAMSCAALLAAPWWLPAIDLPPETVRSDVAPRFYFAATLSADVPPKIRDMSHDALPWVGAGGNVVLRAGPQFAIDVDSRGWNLLGSTVPWWNGWRVYWNGQRLPPVRVDKVYVGTFVPPGTGTIRFRYRPDQFDQGLRLAVAGMLLLIVTLLWPWHVYAAPRTQAFMLALSVNARAVMSRAPALGSWGRWFVSPLRLALRATSRFGPWVVASLFVIYAAVLLTHRVVTAGGSDSSGYLNQARLWSEGRLIIPIPRTLEYAWMPLGFVHGPRPQTMVPSYPPGVPLLMAGMRFFGGEGAPFFLAPLAAIASVLLLYRLARDLGFAPGWAATAAALLALCPTFIFHGLQVMSDVVATAWALAAMTCAFRGVKDTRFALLAGACLGIGVLVRPTQLLLLPAIVVVLGFRNYRPLAALVAGGAPFALLQMGIGRHLFGNPFVTGYGSVLSDLRWSHFPARFAHYSFWLAAVLSPIVFPAGLLGLGRRDVPARVRAALGLWFVPFFLFYCFYGPYETWWYTRFLLPAIPALILATLLLLRHAPALPLALIVACIFSLQLVLARQLDIMTIAKGERVYLDAARIVPHDAVVVSTQHSGSLYYYTGRLSLRYEHLRPGQLAMVRGPIYALVGNWELENLRAHTSLEWVPVAHVRDVMLLKPKL